MPDLAEDEPSPAAHLVGHKAAPHGPHHPAHHEHGDNGRVDGPDVAVAQLHPIVGLQGRRGTPCHHIKTSNN